MIRTLKTALFPATVFALMVLPGPLAGQADIHLSTARQGGGQIPIVVKDLEGETAGERGVAEYIAKVLRRDLEYTSIFQPLQFETGADTLTEGRTATAIVGGKVSKEGETYYLDADLLDFASREVIFSKRYSFTRAARRNVAHHLCDEILFFLIGETGVATTRLLFVRREGENKDLYMIDFDGYGEKRITTDELVVTPTWLDTKRFCFTSYRRGNPDCYLIDLGQNMRRNISHRKGINVAGSFFPERDELAMTLSVKGNSEIYLISPSGEIVRRVTTNRAIDCSPSWAPHGREMVFVSDRTRSPQLYITDAYGGNTRRLRTSGSYNTSPDWSPDGDLIVYVSREGWQFRLKLISPDGLSEETVFEDRLSYEDPCWAPDGRHVAATVKYGGIPWIVIIDIESGTKRRLVQGEAAAWSPLAKD